LRTGALDRGADGIVVLLLHAADESKKPVESARFPPAASRIRNVSQTEYLSQANDGLLTVEQIETKEALDNVR
jgi:4-hydroxy-2-oxoheptanedioate aldolase